MSSYPIERIRKDFPQLSREVRGKTLVYLDNGASTLKPTSVIERIGKYYRGEASNVHRGAHYLSEQGTIAYEGARETVRRFINAPLASEIVFTRGTTESINLVASSWGEQFLKSGDEIILTELEHHSNIVPWQMIAEKKGALIKVVPINEAGDLDFEKFAQLLSTRTKMVSLTWCSNVLGTIVPIERFVEAAHRVGAKVMVDAAQGVSSLVTDVQKMECDFLAFSSHKIFGPYGIGILFGRAELLDSMPPYQGGGSMIANVTWEKTTWADVPHKFEAGTPSIADAIGLGTAIEYVEELGLAAIHKYEQEILTYAISELQKVPGLRVHGDAEQKAAIVSFTTQGAHASDVGALLDQQGVAIRAGHHCCQPLMRKLGVPATARASFSIYNTKQEVDVLFESLLKAREFFT
jgi:cysteine desulfurase/selenocysteine lyase